MRFSSVVLPCLASVAMAQPHKRQHQHAAKHREVRNAEPVIKWVTEIEYTTEIIPVTKTIWVSPGFVPPAESTSTTSTRYKNTVPAQFYEPVKQISSTTTSSSTSTVAPPPPPPPTTTSVQPTTTAPPPPPPVQSPEEKPVEQPSPTPVETTPSPAPVTPIEVPTPPTPAYVAPAAPVETTASSNTGSSSGSGSSSGPCASGSACTGDMTHYEAGLGACGWQSDGATENVVALSHLMMGTQSNGNPFCGKSVTIKHNGKSIVAKVVDKCMGCEIHAIDLSDVAFAALEDMGVGRTQVEWYFN